MAVTSSEAWPIHLESMLSGMPLEIACTPKPWRRPWACGAAGMLAAAMTVVTRRQAVIRLIGHKGWSACPLPRRCASLRPCTSGQMQTEDTLGLGGASADCPPPGAGARRPTVRVPTLGLAPHPELVEVPHEHGRIVVDPVGPGALELLRAVAAGEQADAQGARPAGGEHVPDAVAHDVDARGLD